LEDHRTYFIAESVTFDGGGKCENDDLNTITRRLRKELDDAGWTGLRYVDDNAWPEDFQEATLPTNGLDDLHGDARHLVVYAGHGNGRELQWGQPSDNGVCRVRVAEQVRLGRLAGDTARAAMFLTSCSLRTDILWPNFGASAARQVFGYHNSPHIGASEPRRVFKRTQDGQSTKDAWLDEMEQNAALGKNSPVVVTLGVSGMEAMQAHGTTNLATGAGFVENVGEPADAFFFEWLNNGCTPTCGGCSGIAPEGPPMPKMSVGSKVPIVELVRPHRSIEDLAARASVLISLLQSGPPNTTQRAQLDDWARRSTTSADVALTTFSGPIRLQLAYDPSTDRLVVDDLDAREDARPSVSESPDEGRRRAELVKAEEIRDSALRALDAGQAQFLGVARSSTVSVGTREAGIIEPGGVSRGSVPFEYIFSMYGDLAGIPVFGAQLEIGVTRQGKLSRVAASSVHVTQISMAEIRRSPTEALRTFLLEIAAKNPTTLRLEIVAARVGFATPEAPWSMALVAPELAVDYVVFHSEEGSEPMVSRRYPMLASLVGNSAPRLRNDPEDAVADLGDSRK
jgi:Family of unknown function (DUF6345)